MQYMHEHTVELWLLAEHKYINDFDQKHVQDYYLPQLTVYQKNITKHLLGNLICHAFSNSLMRLKQQYGIEYKCTTQRGEWTMVECCIFQIKTMCFSS